MLPAMPVKIYLFFVPPVGRLMMRSILAMICLLGKHVASLVKDGRGWILLCLNFFLEQDCLDGFLCLHVWLFSCLQGDMDMCLMHD
jgi:hypothetical protein